MDLSNLNISASCTGIFILSLVAFLVYRIWLWERLSHVPGPPFYGISSLALLRTQLSGDVHIHMKEWSEKYGPLVRVSPNTVVTSDPETWQRISGVRSLYQKGDWYRPFRFIKGQDHSFSTVDPAQHAAFRHKIAAAYAGSTAMEDIVGRQVERLVRLMERKFVNEDGAGGGMECSSCSSRTGDIAAVMHFFTLDVIGELQFGKAFGFLDDGEDVLGFIKWNEDFFHVAATVSVVPVLGRIAQLWPFSELLPKATDPTGLGAFIRLSQEVMTERYGRGHDKEKDMIGSFIRSGVSRDEAINQSLVQVVAGTDSVATGIRMALLFVSSNLKVYRRLLAELDEAETKSLISSPIRMAEARQLPYLQAVVKETLRIYPGAVPLCFKTVPAGGDNVAGYDLPAGTQVGAEAWGALHNKRFWGQDADTFRPERWLEADGDRVAAMMECLDFVFSYGRYQCLGRPLVFMELNKVIPELLRRFDFAVVDPVRPAKIRSAGFYLINGFNMVVTRRPMA